MAARRDPRFFFLVIVLLLLINSPEPQQQAFTSRSRFDETVAQEWSALDVINTTHYGEFDVSNNKWLNLTGLKQSDGFAWDLLGPVQERAKSQTHHFLGAISEPAFSGSLREDQHVSVYRNLSGVVQGEWVRSSLGRVRHPSDYNLSAIVPDNPFPNIEYERNLTKSSGSVRLHLNEAEGKTRTNHNRSISEIHIRMVMGDDTTMGDWWEMALHGVHFPDFGASILTTTSEKFAGIFALPHFTSSQYTYSITQELLNRTISETIQRQVARLYPNWNPWSSVVDGQAELLISNPRCEYVVFLQEHPIDFQLQTQQQPLGKLVDIDWMEHELRYPTGSTLPRRSSFSMSIVGFSPDCGFVFESKGPPEFPPGKYQHLVGSKTEEYMDSARRSSMIFAVTLALQLLFLVKQMKETATPSTRNRISFYSVAMLALGDGFAFLALVFMHLYLGGSQLTMYATAFLALFSVIVELRFLMDIWTVQATEQIRLERQQTTSTPPNTQARETTEGQAASTSSTDGDTLPPPATAARTALNSGATPIIIAPDQDDDLTADDNANTEAGATQGTSTRVELGTLYTRYCFLLIFLFFLTLHATSLWTVVRATYFNILCFSYLSFWCPQIYRNIMRNCRKALRWDFVFGQSVVRMIPVTYFYAVSDNILFSRSDLRALLVLAGWVWIQILALISQEILGSRFFIREGWAPPAYDYHPLLREDEEGATMPIGSTQSQDDDSSPFTPKTGESKEKGKKVFDCSICAQDIEVPVLPAGSSADNAPGLGGMILTRRAYMVTPCRHIFHTPCLEGWMRYRLQCPNCREILPPL